MIRRGYYSSRRRAIMSRGEEIDHLLVFERDEWTCHICGNVINRHLRGNNWMRATLDHIQPLSRNGTHTYDNVAAAHWICNMRKGDTMPEDHVCHD
jgi:5-methylcytosine-specific restriction endonuclease McrA